MNEIHQNYNIIQIDLYLKSSHIDAISIINPLKHMLNLSTAQTLLIETSFIGLCWILLYKLNMFGYTGGKLPVISWVFIPAGFKLAVAMIYRVRCLPGLFLGSLWLNINYRPELIFYDQVILSLISALSGYLACILVEKYLKIKCLATKLAPKQLIILSVSYAALNSFIHVLFFKLHEDLFSVRMIELIKMFCGDLLGVILFMMAVKYVAIFLKKIMRKK